MRTRKARLPDAVRIHDLIAEYARERILLPRTLAEICENIRDFTVVEHGGDVVGCGALHFYAVDLVEIRSIAVAPDCKGRGAGRLLVKALLREAREHGVARICLFTHIPDWFARWGFAPVEHHTLPEKIWKDCLKCTRQNCCDETAMVFGAEVAARMSRAETSHPAPVVFRTFPG
jgi:amino-acid N-acetyltransferase